MLGNKWLIPFLVCGIVDGRSTSSRKVKVATKNCEWIELMNMYNRWACPFSRWQWSHCQANVL